MLTRHRAGLIVGVVFCAAGFALFGGAGYIHAKAWLAEALLDRAWEQRLNGAGLADTRPWPWADTAPLARLQVPRLDIDRIVLAGASGRTLAFGAAHLDGTAEPGDRGNSVITGHRDTHFAFVRHLRSGDALRLQAVDGEWQTYRITGSEVFDARTARLDPATDRTILTLVTCYPFDAVVPNGPLRYAVFAERVAPAAATAPSHSPQLQQ